MEKASRPRRPLLYVTSLNPVPNAQVCVFDGMPFLRSNTCAEGGGYLFLPGFSSLYDAIHGWMTGWTDGWKKLHDHDVLYYM
jgi:hypothetical protein